MFAPACNMAGDLPIQKQKIMTEYELIKLGFKKVYLDENAQEIIKPANDTDIYFFYELEIENLMKFQSNGTDELVNNNWFVDFGFDGDWAAHGFEIDSYDDVKKIIDLFTSIKLK
jgi:hypothetical protein